MRIRTQKRWTRAGVESDPRSLYLFGDNLCGRGNAGQACIRGLDNAYGIPTKVAPSMRDGSFLDDKNTFHWAALLQQFRGLDPIVWSDSYDCIVWPEDGIGTGLARMPEKCPQLFAMLEMLRDELFRHVESTQA